MAHFKHIYFNGKNLVQNPTGVQRVAEELIMALDRLLAAEPELADGRQFTLLVPKNNTKALPLSVISAEKKGWFKWLAWEQFDLPSLSANGLNVNLCNIGPLASRNAITMIHDAQVYSTPASYSLPFKLWYRLAQPLLGRRHKRILTVSAFSKSELVRFNVAREDKIHIVANGCDHVLRVLPDDSTVARRGLDQRPYVLSLANTQAHKNIPILLKAFSQPRLFNVTLALFGSATRAQFESLGHSVPENVQFLGRVTDAELAGLMRQALGFACPSLTEGFGLPPLEAMLLGCPSIVAPCGALPEVCGDAVLYADALDPAEWVAQIGDIVDDPALRKRLQEKGLVQASSFTWDRAARQLLAEISTLC